MSAAMDNGKDDDAFIFDVIEDAKWKSRQ